jgi:hypothetical protein
MSYESQDRQRTRQDLQELARLAKSTPASSFKTADSSGYVDLSAFSATDESWVERELERARTGMPAPSRGRSGAINALSPESMAPVALSALLESPPEPAAPRGRRALYVLAGLASIAAVAALAVSVARNAPPPVKTAAATVAAPAPPPATTATPDPTPVAAATPAPDTTTATTPTPAATTTTPRTTSKAQPAKRKIAVAPSHAVAAASQPAARPVVIPQAKSSSGDSLMDMMKASVKAK